MPEKQGNMWFVGHDGPAPSLGEYGDFAIDKKAQRLWRRGRYGWNGYTDEGMRSYTFVHKSRDTAKKNARQMVWPKVLAYAAIAGLCAWIWL